MDLIHEQLRSTMQDGVVVRLGVRERVSYVHWSSRLLAMANFNWASQQAISSLERCVNDGSTTRATL